MSHLPHTLAADGALAKLALCPPFAKEGEARRLTGETHLQRRHRSGCVALQATDVGTLLLQNRDN